MADASSFTLQERPPLDTVAQTLETRNTDSSENQSQDRSRLLVLLGSALSQLPIWGFAMSYGVLQEHFASNWTLDGNKSLTGIIGTTSNGIMYLSMPMLFTLFTQKYAQHRRRAAIVGSLLACGSFILSAFSKHVWHLIITQGILAAFGCALAFSPLTLSLGEWFAPQNRLCNRAVAYGICLSTKNIVGATCPFIFRGILDHYGFRVTMIVWAAITFGASIMSIAMIQTPLTTLDSTAENSPRRRKVPWSFLTHRTFWIYAIATLLQSAGYGIPQTYLSEYARTVSLMNPTFSTLLITLINIPGICSSTFFGVLSDNTHLRLSALTVTAISSLASALAAFLFWGLAGQGGKALLVLFAITFGFFASGYSATWGGIVNDLEEEAARKNEAIDSGVLYGLLNGARGVGYVSGGLVSVPLIKAGSQTGLGESGYGTMYGPLIAFTGLSLAFGGWGVVFRPWWKRLC